MPRLFSLPIPLEFIHPTASNLSFILNHQDSALFGNYELGGKWNSSLASMSFPVRDKWAEADLNPKREPAGAG